MLETGSNQQHNVYCITQQTCQHDIEQIYAMGIPVFGTVRATLHGELAIAVRTAASRFHCGC